MADVRLKKYKTSRNSCLNEMSILHSLAERAKTDNSVRTLFKVRYSEIDILREDFLKHHQSVLSLLLTEQDADLNVEETIREGFLNDFFVVKTVYMELFENESAQRLSQNFNDSTVTTQQNSHVRLPKLEIPKFNGDYKAFVTFLDLFDALVHDNTTLSSVEKFNYLISSLEGQPLSLVRTLPMTAENYQTAYDTLVERYSNKRIRAQMHWSAIENTTKISAHHSNALRKLLDIFSENLAALKTLHFPVDKWDFILVMMLLKRLDNATVTRFELEHGSSDIPCYKSLIEFLNKQCIAYDTLNFSSSAELSRKPNIVKSKLPHSGNRTTSFLINKSSSSKCPLCKENHSLYTCPAFLNKTPNERYNLCKSLHLCFNCLSNIHDIRTCRSLSTCRRCNQKHHTLLHFEKHTTNNFSSAENDVSTQPSTSQGNLASSSSATSTTNPVFSAAGVLAKNQIVLLSTALIEIRDNSNNYQILRCLLDPGSMSSFITQKAVNRLGLSSNKFAIEVKGLGDMQTYVSHGRVTISFKPLGQPLPLLSTDAIILNKICDNLPSSHIPVQTWSHISNLKLADPNFYSPGAIDILLGADVFSKLILNGRIVGNEGEPDALNTIFGYVLMGKLNCNGSPVSSFFCNTTENSLDSLNSTLKTFWEIETVPTLTLSSPEDELCEQMFLETHMRDDTGKFIVSLPFRESAPPVFPGMRDLALQRFYSLERRLLKQPSLYLQYCEFMREYLELGHMDLISPDNISSNTTSPHTYYIPHHCVLKPDSSTTKLRVVFNASAKTPNQTSLNDHLLTGPKLQRDIFELLLKFRLHTYVLCADIKQMYRMILITPAHRDFQRIIWRFNTHEPPQDFRLNTVTYGVSSAPYLALRTLLQLATEEELNFPLAANAIKFDTYVDDIVTGCSSLEDARNLQKQLIFIMEKGGFELRKWASNDPDLLSQLPASHLSKHPLTFDSDLENALIKILGLQWNPAQDSFLFSVCPLDRPCTKRNMLSELARVFDPVGFLAPVTFFTKHLIQKLWTLGIQWDDEPNNEILRAWNQYKTELPLLSKLQIPRKLISEDAIYYELHSFCDASEKGYAAVIFLKTTHKNNSISVNFICAKTKVAPLKRITIPRLELCAAVLLTKLISFVSQTYNNLINFRNIYAWSDSQIVLSWIKSPPYRWKTFVSNRVAFIQEKIPPSSWFYIESRHNPADVGSRGLLPSDLLSHSLWFNGPPFLLDQECSKLKSFNFELTDDVSDEERKVTLFINPQEDNSLDLLLNKFSSFLSLQRTLAYCIRFIFNSKNPLERKSGPLTYSELHNALLTLVKRTQGVAFEDELNRKVFSKPLRKLNAFIDDQGILRVGGRLKYSHLTYDRKHPILLPRQSNLTVLLIEFYHKKYFHAGLRTLEFLLAQQFWVLSPKRSIRSVLAKCVTCWKTNPKAYQPPMGNLPATRISCLKPFSHSGVDFGGPFFITMSRHRGVRTSKAYICLFVCFSTKAIHLELASDLSSETFLAALQRFIARRGRCNCLYSDCGTNFVGANKILQDMMKTAATQEQIEWHFNPPSAPHFGGLFEAGIKSVKSHLTRVIGQQVLSYEEFYTVLTLIESILNSRPLSPMTSDLEDITALTPGHFLTMEPLSPFPTPDMTATPINRLSRWQLLQRLHQEFWRRWHREYLHTLQQRSKWLDPSSTPKIGTLVLIKNENLPPCQWLLGRIISLRPGLDGVARVASIKTASGTLTRPLVKLCPLPVS